MIPKLFEHQTQTVQFIMDTPKCMITSDPGTGKTRCVLEAFREIKRTEGGRMLVFAPKSILTPAWLKDAEKFTPELLVGVSTAPNREPAYNPVNDVVVTNHDAVKWIIELDKEKRTKLLSGMRVLCIDEFTAFKTRTAQRSRAMNALAQLFDRVIIMSGTPNSNTILDVWHPVYLLDQGQRLGANFFRFRHHVCAPQQVGPDPRMVKWSDKDGAEEAVADLIKDINIRYRFEDCISIPENHRSHVEVTLPPALMAQYRELAEASVLWLESGEFINAVHAGARAVKLLQLVSGAVYDGQGNHHKIHTDRYELVMELVSERKHSVVAFNWGHQRNELTALADRMNISYAVIDGSVSTTERNRAVQRFQDGELQVLFCQPASASHGLTLTRGNTIIWASPTYNAEHFQQFNRRIYRAGQTQRTETILISAVGTWEQNVYERLDNKLTRMESLLSVLRDLTATVQNEEVENDRERNHRSAEVHQEVRAQG